MIDDKAEWDRVARAAGESRAREDLFERLDAIERLLERIAAAVENPLLQVDTRTGEIKKITGNPRMFD